jgi:hypothetical protein
MKAVLPIASIVISAPFFTIENVSKPASFNADLTFSTAIASVSSELKGLLMSRRLSVPFVLLTYLFTDPSAVISTVNLSSRNWAPQYLFEKVMTVTPLS